MKIAPTLLCVLAACVEEPVCDAIRPGSYRFGAEAAMLAPDLAAIRIQVDGIFSTKELPVSAEMAVPNEEGELTECINRAEVGADAVGPNLVGITLYFLPSYPRPGQFAFRLLDENEEPMRAGFFSMPSGEELVASKQNEWYRFEF